MQFHPETDIHILWNWLEDEKKQSEHPDRADMERDFLAHEIALRDQGRMIVRNWLNEARQ